MDVVPLDVLIAWGLVNPPTGSPDELLDSPGVTGPAEGPSAEDILSELREDRT